MGRMIGIVACFSTGGAARVIAVVIAIVVFANKVIVSWTWREGSVALCRTHPLWPVVRSMRKAGGVLVSFVNVSLTSFCVIGVLLHKPCSNG